MPRHTQKFSQKKDPSKNTQKKFDRFVHIWYNCTMRPEDHFKGSPWTAVILILLILITMMMSACYKYDPYNPYEFRDPDDPVMTPSFEDASVSCHWDQTINDYVWHFEAWVTYPRLDFKKLKTVYVEVYEGEYLVNWFELFHDSGKYWDTHRLQRLQTKLYCEYYGDYEASFIVLNHKNESDAMTVWEIDYE